MKTVSHIARFIAIDSETFNVINSFIYFFVEHLKQLKIKITTGG